jgi:hypothetical protein
LLASQDNSRAIARACALGRVDGCRGDDRCRPLQVAPGLITLYREMDFIGKS